MELHERWLAELHSESMKHKLALAEGKITNEEYMENINKTEEQSDLNDKVWSFSDLNLQQVYRLRNHAAKAGNGNLLSAIKGFLNIRHGATGKPATHLQLRAVTIEEVLVNVPPEVKVVIDHEIVDTHNAENRSHELREFIHNKFDGKISIVFHSGLIDGDRLENDHVVLLALNTGFAILKARGTTTSGCIVVYLDLSRESLRQQTAEVDLSAGFPKPGEPLSPDDDPGQFYRSGFGNEPLLPHETPGQAYALSAQAEEARVQLELTEMSIKRFGYILADPETGLTVSKEEQDKHVQAIVDAANSRKK